MGTYGYTAPEYIATGCQAEEVLRERAMTNITYFYNTIREYYSSSSSASSSFSEHQTLQHRGAAAEVKVEDDDNSTISAIKLSSKFVFPTYRHSTFRCFDTRNFQPSGLSSVFEAWVDGLKLKTCKELGRGSVAVCVKVFNQNGSRNHTEFLGRGNYLASIRHPNLVRLLGYSLENTRCLLVYEFTSQGCLENHHLVGPVSKAPLLNVALDAAKGLAFLHSSQIVHGCFNASSIVLDPNNNAKLFGFELTKNCPTKFPIGVMETPSGDFGYTIGYEAIYDAPEYLYRGEISAKSDVYSFGVVFLEILFGRRAFGKYWKFWSLAEQNLVEWITSYPSLKPQFVDVLHSCIYCQLKGGENAVLLALRCVSVEVKFRPTMDEVVKALEELLHENKMAKLKYLSPSRISTMMEV